MNPFFSQMMSALGGTAARAGLTALGTAIGMQGLASDSNVNLFVGIGMGLAALGWSAVQKYTTISKLTA